MPSKANTRRRLIETYLASNGVAIDRLLELDAMLGTLDFVARTDWMAILPGIMMANETRSRQFTVNPIAAPPFSLDLVLIEPARRPMSPGAKAFLDILEEESLRLNRRWETAGRCSLELNLVLLIEHVSMRGRPLTGSGRGPAGR